MNIFVTGLLFKQSYLTYLSIRYFLISYFFLKSFVALLPKNEQKVFYCEKSYCKATYVSLN